ncbi:hypothetical protein [Microbispora sp. GKU 823]|uniref:hypothetical protein n=1 Tax=Microbispora sp. GKU 823 TaxID=1652100 RepID=UPI0021199D7E|nr:hypothetical protein [Microbispora sp. GKU 823]
MAWQPMPAPTNVSSEARVEALCGQPEQKYGVRDGDQREHAALPRPEDGAGDRMAACRGSRSGPRQVTRAPATSSAPSVPRAVSSSRPMTSGRCPVSYNACLRCPSRNGTLSSTTSTRSSPAVMAARSSYASGNGMASRMSRRPRWSIAASSRPRSARARRTTAYEVPDASTPVVARGASWVTRLRPCARAYSRARPSLRVSMSCSASSEAGPTRVGGAPRSARSGTGMPSRSGPTSTVAEASATSATIFRPAQRPVARDSATACSPSSTTSATEPGASSGIDRLWHIGSQELGTVDDLLPGSSPIQATAPPSGAVPARLPCRIASAARSRPGFFPYQNPVTPSCRRPGTWARSWVPATAVAASSSLRPGRATTPASLRNRAALAISRSTPASGEPGYPETKTRVSRPRSASRRRCSRVSRTRAWMPEISTVPCSAAYLSSSETGGVDTGVPPELGGDPQHTNIRGARASITRETIEKTQE